MFKPLYPTYGDKKEDCLLGKCEFTKYYLLNGVSEFGSCAATIVNIESEETHGMVLIEIEALASVDGNTTSRILRRTLQRP